jgi:flagellin
MREGNINASLNKVTSVGHGLTDGAKVELTTNVGTPEQPSGTTWTHGATDAYVKYVDANTFEVYKNYNNTTGVFTNQIVFDADVADNSFRFSVEDSAQSVVINDMSGELKKGMFLTSSPIATGEDPNAVLAKSGDIVSIAKTTQDISAFATEQDGDYDDVNLKSVLSSQIALSLVKLAITQVATDRARLGAVQSRLNFTNEQLTVTKENLSAAISRIADVDVAEEATSYARYQILVSSGVEMLKQANQLPQSALQLLR